jgi:integrase
MGHSEYDPAAKERRPWNAGRKHGAKRALKAQQVWAIRFWLDRERRLRDRAMFDLAIDSKLRGCDIVKIKIGDLVGGGRVRPRAIVVQQKTGRPVQFELLEPALGSLFAWLERRGGTLDDYAFPSRIDHGDYISTQQYARFVDEWITGIGLRREDYGPHSLRRTKASIIYTQTGNLRAVATALAKNCARAGIILSSSANAGAPTAAYVARGGFAAVGDRAGPHASDFVGDGGVAVDPDGI